MSGVVYKTINKRYLVEKYNPLWVTKFEAIKKQLATVFKDKALRIEHVGSTSIPGMMAKPIIDVLVIVEKNEPFISEKEMMQRLGYKCVDNYLAENSVFFSKDIEGDRIENIHLFPKNHPKVSEFLDIRDYLKIHPKEVEAYQNLKIELFKKFPDNYIQYRTNKDEFLKSLLVRAQEWRSGN